MIIDFLAQAKVYTALAENNHRSGKMVSWTTVFLYKQVVFHFHDYVGEYKGQEILLPMLVCSRETSSPNQRLASGQSHAGVDDPQDEVAKRKKRTGRVIRRTMSGTRGSNMQQS